MMYANLPPWIEHKGISRSSDHTIDFMLGGIVACQAIRQDQQLLV